MWPRRPQIAGSADHGVVDAAEVDSQNAIKPVTVHRPDRCRRGANTGISDNDIDPAALLPDGPDRLLHRAAI